MGTPFVDSQADSIAFVHTLELGETQHCDKKGRDRRDTYDQLPGPAQTLDLVDPVPDRSQLLFETFLLNHIPCSMED